MILNYKGVYSSFFSYNEVVRRMSKKEEFKVFAKRHPELIRQVHKGDTTWQKLYEIYDIYGDDDRAWQNYLTQNDVPVFGNITDIVKKIDMDSVQKHINTAQKALGIVQELTGSNTSSAPAKDLINPTPRPINKFFED